nr:hypothetical protein HPHPH23_0878 [Helicobacter pylori Hp H-23]
MKQLSPYNPQLNPPNPRRPLFNKVIACLSSLIIYLKNAKAFFKFYKFY